MSMGLALWSRGKFGGTGTGTTTKGSTIGAFVGENAQHINLSLENAINSVANNLSNVGGSVTEGSSVSGKVEGN